MSVEDVQHSDEGSTAAAAPGRNARVSRLLDFIAVDYRSMAVFRILFALVLLGDLYQRADDIAFFYSDEGILPRVDLWRTSSDAFVSFHSANGTWQFEALLFVIAAIAHTAFLFGFHTRAASVLSWILVVSINRRNPQILQGGDDLIRCLAFWSMFLPLGTRWSLDSRISGALPARPSMKGIAALMPMIQMALLYIFSSTLKTGPAWKVDGTAIRYALEVDQFTKPFGYFMLSFPEILRWMTFSVWYLEQYAPYVAFIPWKNAFFRTLTVFTFVGFHIGLFLSMELGPFPAVCIAGWSYFLPTAFWDRVLPESIVSGRATGAAKGNVWLRLATALRDVILLLILANIIAWNVRSTDFSRWESWYPRSLNFICQSIGVDQYWAMFAPTPLTLDGWYLIPATTTKNRVVNLSPGAHPDDPITDEKPLLVSSTYPTERWRKYMMNLTGRDNQFWRVHFVTALARKWNRAHPDEKIKTIDIYYWFEPTVLNAPPERRKELLWHYDSGLR